MLMMTIPQDREGLIQEGYTQRKTQQTYFELWSKINVDFSTLNVLIPAKEKHTTEYVELCENGNVVLAMTYDNHRDRWIDDTQNVKKSSLLSVLYGGNPLNRF